MAMYNYFPDKEIKSQCQRQGSAHILNNTTFTTMLHTIIICKHSHFVSLKKSPLVHAIMAPNRSAQSYKQECREETF